MPSVSSIFVSLQVASATPHDSQAPLALRKLFRVVWDGWRQSPPSIPHHTSCARRAAAPGVLKRYLYSFL